MPHPTLLEVQQAMRRNLLGHGAAAAASHAEAPGHEAPVPGLGGEALARLSIYRNTCRSVLVKALRLSFPAVERLVGVEFFEGAAQHFIDEASSGLPRSAWLNEYGAGWADFLASFAPAAAVPYLADVARLEWAVNGALHAPDASRLDAARLAEEVQAEVQANAEVRFVPHASLALLALRFPADAIWRAVLAQDEAALAAVDPADGPVWLLVERDAAGVQVCRLREAAWRFTARLCAREPLHAVLDEGAEDVGLRKSAAFWLGEHLAAGRFVAALSGDAPS